LGHAEGDAVLDEELDVFSNALKIDLSVFCSRRDGDDQDGMTGLLGEARVIVRHGVPLNLAGRRKASVDRKKKRQSKKLDQDKLILFFIVDRGAIVT